MVDPVLALALARASSSLSGLGLVFLVDVALVDVFLVLAGAGVANTSSLMSSLPFLVLRVFLTLELDEVDVVLIGVLS